MVLAGHFICGAAWCTSRVLGLATFSLESKSFGCLLVSGGDTRDKNHADIYFYLLS